MPPLWWLLSVTGLLNLILIKLEVLVADGQALDAKLDEVLAEVAAQGEALGAAIARVEEDVQFLRDNPGTPEDHAARIARLDEALSAMRGVRERLAALDPVPENPAPEAP